jgi:hypothetical protein
VICLADWVIRSEVYTVIELGTFERVVLVAALIVAVLAVCARAWR